MVKHRLELGWQKVPSSVQYRKSRSQMGVRQNVWLELLAAYPIR
jgi:hypothetical protein